MRWLEERGVGVPVGAVRVPIVPAAVLYDLWLGDARIRPDAEAGYAACAAASTNPPAQGSVGAGAGATVGKLWGFARAMKGGIGSASVRAGGITVGALVAVNAVGDVIDRATGRPLAGARSEDGRTLVGSMAALLRGDLPAVWQLAGSTTIGVVATDAVLTKAQAQKVAQMAHDGLARTIDPVHTPSDGDTLFALATGASSSAANLTLIGALTAEAVAAAVLNAVREATAFRRADLPWIPALRDL